MRVDVLLLASLPSALAGRLAYTPPADLLAKVAANDDCVLPGNYKIKGFSGQSNDTENTLGSFNFRFIDSETKIESLCHFNSSSESTTPGGLTPRYPCENGEVKFIWEDDERSLWMIERVCPGEDGYVLLRPCSATDTGRLRVGI